MVKRRGKRIWVESKGSQLSGTNRGPPSIRSKGADGEHGWKEGAGAQSFFYKHTQVARARSLRKKEEGKNHLCGDQDKVLTVK